MKLANRLLFLVCFTLAVPFAAEAQYYGNLSVNPALPPALPQPPGTFDNPFGTSGTSPRLYDSQGNYRGNLNANQFDPNSVANPFGRYGSQFSPDSINNQFGAGSPFRQDSPTNPFGQGLGVYGPDGR
jgi:hypothetical protein